MKLSKGFILSTVPLLVVLATSIALNCFLYSRGRQYYLQLNETRLDPLGLSYYVPTPSQSSASDEVQVVFFGDSRAANWPFPNLSGFEFIDRGIGAQTSAQVIQRFEYHVKPLRPEVVVVQVGINDLKTIPLFPERKESIIANCKENIGQIVEQSTDLGATVVLGTIFPVGEVPLERRLFWSDEIALAVDEVNTYIGSLAGESVIVFDAFSILADGKGVTRREYSWDELHLNTTGYETLNGELTEVLTLLGR